MISNILPNVPALDAFGYHLPETDRQSILAKSDSAILRADIERKRQEFIQRYGNAFGVIEPQ